MAYTTVNTGIDRKITLIDENGNQYSFDSSGNGLGGNLMSFKSEPVITQITSKPISNGGEQIVQDERVGWKGDFMVERTNGDGEDLENLQEVYYRTTGRSLKFTIHETTVNADGSGLTKWIYKNQSLRMTSTGESKMGSSQEQAYSFEGGGRVAG